MNRYRGIAYNFHFKLVQRAVKEADGFWQLGLRRAGDVCQIPPRVFARCPQSLSGLHELWRQND